MSDENFSILALYDHIDEKCWRVNKKLSHILSSKYDNSYNYIEVHPLDWKLDELDNFILATLINERHLNKKSITNKLKRYGDKHKSLEWRDPFYKNIQRNVDSLYKKNFLEKVDTSQIKYLKKKYPHYKLSINGIFYSILNWYHEAFMNIDPGAMLSSLLKYYPECALLQHFLYPYFEKKTLEKISEDLNYRLLEYLYEVCKVIIEIKRNSETDRSLSIEGMIPEYFFQWPSSEENSPSRYRNFFHRKSNFRHLLFRELNWKWVYDASIDPQFEYDKIIIKSPFLKSDASIKIDREKRTVKLIFGKEKYSSFKVVVNQDNTIDVFGKSIINERKNVEEILRYSCNLKTIEMIFSILTKKDGESYPLYESVKNDKKFKAYKKSLIDILTDFEF